MSAILRELSLPFLLLFEQRTETETDRGPGRQMNLSGAHFGPQLDSAAELGQSHASSGTRRRVPTISATALSFPGLGRPSTRL